MKKIIFFSLLIYFFLFSEDLLFLFSFSSVFGVYYVVQFWDIYTKSYMFYFINFFKFLCFAMYFTKSGTIYYKNWYHISHKMVYILWKWAYLVYILQKVVLYTIKTGTIYTKKTVYITHNPRILRFFDIFLEK